MSFFHKGSNKLSQRIHVRRRIGWFVLFWLSASTLLAQVPVPDLTGRVVDLTGTLTNQEITDLSAKLVNLENQKGSQIAILIVDTTQLEPIEDFSIRVAEKWKIGRKKIDDGIIIVVAINDRKMRIEVGYGLEGAIPDAKAKQIISEQMAPAFREGNFAGGLNTAIDSLTLLIDGEELPEPESQSSFEEEGSENFAFFGSAAVAFVLHLFIPTVVAVLIASVGVWLFSGLVFGFSLGSFFIILIGAVVGVTFYRFSSGGSGGFSSGGGGGYSGGGGSFGGGGSSGSW